MSWSFSDSSLDFSQDCINFDGTNNCQGSAGDKVKEKKTSWEQTPQYPDFDLINKARRKEEAKRKEERLNLKVRAKEILAQPEFSEMGEAEKLLLLEEEDLDGLIVLLLLI